MQRKVILNPPKLRTQMPRGVPPPDFRPPSSPDQPSQPSPAGPADPTPALDPNRLHHLLAHGNFTRAWRSRLLPVGVPFSGGPGGRIFKPPVGFKPTGGKCPNGSRPQGKSRSEGGARGSFGGAPRAWRSRPDAHGRCVRGLWFQVGEIPPMGLGPWEKFARTAGLHQA